MEEERWEDLPEKERKRRLKAEIERNRRKRRARGEVREEEEEEVGPGTFWGGFAVAFVGGCIGWALVLHYAKRDVTRRGAWWGVLAQLVAGVVGRMLFW
jgi:hypothetical protein